MNGKVVIEITEVGQFTLDVRVKQPSKLGWLCIFDGLIESMKLSDMDRMMFGLTIAAGGMKTISGRAPDMVEMSTEVVDRLKKMKGTQDD